MKYLNFLTLFVVVFAKTTFIQISFAHPSDLQSSKTINEQQQDHRTENLQVIPKKIHPKVQNILEERGTVLDWTSYLSVHNLLIFYMDKLSNAQIQLINERAGKIKVTSTINEVYLLESNDEIAFVLRLGNELRKGVLTNRIGISTGFIKKIWFTANQDLLNFSKYILGIMAHEMAHPVEQVQSGAVSRGWKNGQGAEALADYDALSLLRESGLPEESLYLGLKILLDSKVHNSEPNDDLVVPKALETVEAMRSTHPENSLRLSFQRLGLTFGRKLYGQNQIDFKLPAINEERLMTQLEALSALEVRFDNKKSDLSLPFFPRGDRGDLAEIQKALDELLDQSTPTENENLLFNHLLLLLGERLVTEPEPTIEFKSWLIDLFIQYLKGNTPTINYEQFPDQSWGMSQFRLITKLQNEFQSIHPAPIAKLLTKVPWLNQTSFVNSFYNQYAMKISPSLEFLLAKSQEAINPHITSLLPTHFIFLAFKNEIYQHLKSQLHKLDTETQNMRRNKLSSQIVQFTSQFPLVQRFQLSDYILRNGNLESHFYLHKNQTARSALSPFITNRLSESDNEKIITAELIENKENAELQRIVAYHQKNKLFLALTDIYLSLMKYPDYREHYTDWSTLQKLDNQDENYQEIQSTFASFTQTKDFVDWIRNHLSELEKSELRFTPTEGFDNSFRLVWWNSELTEALIGKNNLFLKEDPELLVRWQKFVIVSLFQLDFKSFSIFTKEDLLKKFNEKSQPPKFNDWIMDIFFRFKNDVQKLLSVPENEVPKFDFDNLWIIHEMSPIYLEALEQSTLNTSEKIILAEDVLRWNSWVLSNQAPEIVSLISQAKKTLPPSRWLKKVTREMKLDESHYFSQGYLALIYSTWEKPLSEELRSIKSEKDFYRFIKDTFGFGSKGILPYTLGRSQLINLSLSKLANFKITEDLVLKYFLLIVRNGGTFQSDKYLREKILPYLKTNEVKTDLIKTLISGTRTQTLQIELAQIYFNKLKMIPFENLQTVSGAKKFVKELDKLLPFPSPEKDAMIEDFLWSYHVNDLNLLGELSSAKANGGRRQLSPLAVQLGSGLSKNFAEMSRQETWSLLAYLSTAEDIELPTIIKGFADRLSEFAARPYKGSPVTSERVQANRKLQILSSIITLKGLPWVEKIPTFEFLLTLGDNPWVKDSIVLNENWLMLLGLSTNTKVSLVLQSYLESIPTHEISVTLAYLLARKGENLDLDSGKLRDIFELFEIVGKKIGQAAHTWKLVDGSVDLRDLKDHATPMLKLQIVSAVYKHLGPEIANEIIDYQIILASGSIKTVTLVRFKNGKTAALETLSEHAEAQIRSSLYLAKKLILKLQYHGLISDETFIGNLISRLEYQLKTEVDFRHEAQQLVHARNIFLKVENSLDVRIKKGWRFIVPQPISGIPVTQKVMIVDLAQGQAIDHLTESEKTEVGPLLFDAYILALLKFGWIDADRTVANQLIDPKSRRIYILDLGQAYQLEVKTQSFVNQFQRDDRLRVFSLLMAIKKNSIILIEQSINPLLNQNSRVLWKDPKIKDQLLSRWKKALLENVPLNIFLIQVISDLENHDIHFEDKFSVTTIKGIMTLFAEPYANPQQQMESFQRASKALVKEKIPAIIMGGVYNSCQILFTNASKAIKK
ncbi:MAG TPA: AarF/UbiB family protein [Pseudobdellovibrionaceae bacterium]|mgnify:CR=1 FL=1|nr:AarF/UbiB family protein [Pseudobdellovibrionaceae bacterium]